MAADLMQYEGAPQTPRQRYLREWQELDTEYSTWKPVHQDIVDFLQPGRGRFELSQQNRGQRKDAHVVNDTGIDAENKAASAMDTGITSPAREWFRLTTSDPQSNEQDDVREALREWQDVLFQAFAKSNFYQANRNLYLDLIGPGTGLMFMEPDAKELVRFTHIPIGQYRLATNSKGRVCKVLRRFSMTVRQLVGEFCTAADGTVDVSKCSQRVKDAWERKQIDATWIDVLHAVEERLEREPGKIDSKNKPWASCWMEFSDSSQGGFGGEQLPLLRESGFDKQPFVAPRWAVVGEDSYGRSSPGWQSLGDVKALQAMEKGSAKIVAKIGDPALNVPNDLRNASTLPGARNPVPNSSQHKIEATHAIPPEAVTVVAQEKRVMEQRIQRAHFADLLLIISNDERGTPPTAEEVRAKKEERLLQLGGVFARYADEGLKIVIDFVLYEAQLVGLIRAEPEMARVMDLRVEFENPLVTAQRTIQIASVDRLIAITGNLAQIGRTDALDVLDVDEILSSAADMLGVKPNMLRNEQERAQIRQQRAQAVQQQQQNEQMKSGAPALKQLSETDPDKLREIVNQFGPSVAAQATGNGA